VSSYPLGLKEYAQFGQEGSVPLYNSDGVKHPNRGRPTYGRFYEQALSIQVTVRTLTGHEIRKVHSVVAFFCIVICKKLVVDEFDPEGVGDNNNNTVHRSAARGSAHISVQAVKLD
jgi:hypothetical protein